MKYIVSIIFTAMLVLFSQWHYPPITHNNTVPHVSIGNTWVLRPQSPKVTLLIPSGIHGFHGFPFHWNNSTNSEINTSFSLIPQLHIPTSQIHAIIVATKALRKNTYTFTQFNRAS